jgi:hypothetical protein
MQNLIVSNKKHASIHWEVFEQKSSIGLTQDTNSRPFYYPFSALLLVHYWHNKRNRKENSEAVLLILKLAKMKASP